MLREGLETIDEQLSKEKHLGTAKAEAGRMTKDRLGLKAKK
jgi:hypothetical protein